MTSVPITRRYRHAATASPDMLARVLPAQATTTVTPTVSPMASPVNNGSRAVAFMPPERYSTTDAGEPSAQVRADQPGSTWAHLGPITGFDEYSQTTSSTVTPEPRSAGAMSMPLSGFRAAAAPATVAPAAATAARPRSGTSVTFAATPTSTFASPTGGSQQPLGTPTKSVPVSAMARKRASTDAQVSFAVNQDSWNGQAASAPFPSMERRGEAGMVSNGIPVAVEVCLPSGAQAAAGARSMTLAESAAGATAVKSMSLAEATDGFTAVKSMSLAEAADGFTAVKSMSLAEAAAGKPRSNTWAVDELGDRGKGLTTMPVADFRREAAAFRREAAVGAISNATNSMTLAGAGAGATAGDQQGGIATMPATAFRGQQPLRIPKAQSAELDAIAFGSAFPMQAAEERPARRRYKTVQLGDHMIVELKVKVVAPGGGTAMNGSVYQRLGHRQDISLEILGQSRAPYDRYTEAWGPPSGGPPPNLESFALDLLAQGALERCDCLVVGSRGGQVCLPTFWRMKGGEVPPAVIINGGCAMGLPISVPWPDSAVTFIMIGGQDYFRQQFTLDQYLDDARSRVPPNNSTTAIMLVCEMAHMPQSQLLDAVLHSMIKAVTLWNEDSEDIPTKEFEKIVSAVTAFGFHGTLIYKIGIGDAWKIIPIPDVAPGPTDSMQMGELGMRKAATTGRAVPIYCD